MRDGREKLLRKTAETGCWERLPRKTVAKGCCEKLLKKAASFAQSGSGGPRRETTLSSLSGHRTSKTLVKRKYKLAEQHFHHLAVLAATRCGGRDTCVGC